MATAAPRRAGPLPTASVDAARKVPPVRVASASTRAAAAASTSKPAASAGKSSHVDDEDDDDEVDAELRDPAAIDAALQGKRLLRGVSGNIIRETAAALSIEDSRVAARVAHFVVKLQGRVRTRRARREYGHMLLDKYVADEEAHAEEERRKLEEGLRFLERKNTEKDLMDEAILRSVMRHQRGIRDTPAYSPST